MILSVKSLSKTYKQGDTEIHAVRDFDLDMQIGETLSIIGPSGSGKTTLLSLLAGLDDPSKGEIEMAGEKITTMTEKQLSDFRAKNMGIVFQQFHLMPYLTALENVMLPLEISGQPDVRERAMQSLESVGLKDRADHLPSQMSGGECQRVAIARALVIEPKVLLADEPSGNLDTETGEVIMDLLFSLVQKNKMSLVLVTHNPEHAKKCQRVISMKAGRVQ